MINAYSARGLSQVEVTQRRSEDGYNELPSAKRRNVLAIVAEVLREPMLLLLIAAGGVYLLISDRRGSADVDGGGDLRPCHYLIPGS